MNSRDEKFVIKFPAMLAEVKSEPLGLGTGELVVGETFILKVEMSTISSAQKTLSISVPKM